MISEYQFKKRVEECIEEIDFDKILTMMDSVDWTYALHDEMTEEILIETIRGLAQSVYSTLMNYKPKVTAVSTGGFTVVYYRKRDTLSVKFIVDEWTSGEDIYI